MSNTPSNVLQMARQGNPDAIAALMNRHLEAQGITAHVAQQDRTLQVSLESAQVPNQADLVAYVKKGIAGLDLATVHHLTVSAKQPGSDTSAWSEDLVLKTPDADEFDLDFNLGGGLDTDTALGLELDPDLEFDLSDGLDLEGPAAEGTTLENTTLTMADFDMALGDDLGDAELDLDLSFDDSSLDDSPSDLGTEAADFDLDAALGETADSGDFDLDFGEATADADIDGDAIADFDLDFGAADAGAASEPSGDLNFDLDLTEAPSPAELDFDLGETSADLAAAGLDLDFGVADDLAARAAAADLDFGLGLTDQSAEAAVNTGDPLAAEPTPDDFDLDFDLGDTPADNTAAADLDFDLGEADAPEGDLDFDLGEADTSEGDLDFDLAMTDAPAAADLDLSGEPVGGEPAAEFATEDFDFDLGDTPEQDNLAAELDFDLGEADNPAADLDFDLGEADNPAADLDFDLGEADNSAADLDFDLADSSAAVEGSELDFDLDSSDFGGDSAATPEAAADLDLDFGADAEPQGAEDLALEEAIAADNDFNFDLTAPATPTEPDTTDDLDDLWGDDRPTPDSAPGAGAAEADLDDMAAIDDELNLGDDDLSTGDLNFDAIDSGFEEAGFGDEGFETEAFDLEELEPAAAPEITGLAGEEFAAEASAPESDVLPDLESTFEPTFEAETPDPEDYLDLGLEDVPPELLAPEDMVFEDLGAAADLDLSEPVVAEGWAAEPDLAFGAEADLGSYSSSDTDLELTDLDSFADISDAPGEEADGGFDPNLAFDADDAEQNLADEPEFDPGLTFAPEADADYTTPNPFEVEAFPLEDAADAGFDPGFDTDLPFSTMELDQTVEGDLMPSDDLALDDDFGAPDDFGDITLDQPDLYGTVDADLTSVGAVDQGSEDLAFESVEFAADDLNVPGFDSGFDDGGFENQGFGDPDFGAPGLPDEDIAIKGLDDPGFGEPGFDDEGFDDGSFDVEDLGNRSASANGFLPNGAALAEDEPDATDDFIQEFGSDPSSHVSLTPDQFNEDGSVRRSGGSGLPMKLILGLGLGAVVLALAVLLLNGLLGRLRQPGPGVDPAVTEPAAPTPEGTPGDTPEAVPPVDPAAVEEADLFRQAVNAAQSAANQAQTANSAAEWQAVADLWANSIALMQQVPETDPNYALAQQKAVEYQPNLAYAQQNVQQF